MLLLVQSDYSNIYSDVEEKLRKVMCGHFLYPDIYKRIARVILYFTQSTVCRPRQNVKYHLC